MSRRVRDVLILYGLALSVNGLVALLVRTPGYPDAYYYFNGGVFLVEGQGLEEPYLWNYVSAWPSLPAPAFAYWQPLPSFLAALGIALFGRRAAFGSAQAIYVIVGSALAPLTYWVTAQIGERRHALLAGLLAVFSGFYVIYWSLPETFTPFALSGAGALALAGRGRQSGRGWDWVLAGACAGLAHLTRADGLLLIGVVGLAALIAQQETAGRGKAIASRYRQAASAILGCSIVMAPWLMRNWITFGSPQPPGGLSTLWLTDYNELFSYPPTLTPERYFALGWRSILKTKGEALLANLATFVGVQNLVFLTPFSLIGLARRWRNDWLLPALIHLVGLLAVMSLAFTLPGMRGGYFHSAGALTPFICAAGALGLDDTLSWVAARRRSWRLETARQVFGAAAVGLAASLTVFLVLSRVVGLPDLSTVRWNIADRAYDQIGDWMDAHGIPRDARVMSNNPPGFYTHTGRGGIPLVNGDEATLLRAADDYSVSWLVVDRNVPAKLESLYSNGPTTDRLRLVATFGDKEKPVYLYHILPNEGE